MRTHQITAIFASIGSVRAAIKMLQQQGIEHSRINVLASYGISVVVAKDDLDTTRSTLFDLGALDTIVTDNTQ